MHSIISLCLLYGADGKKSADAWMTVKHNGVVIHDKVKLPRATTAAPVAEGAEPGPLFLQDHGERLFVDFFGAGFLHDGPADLCCDAKGISRTD